MSKLFRMGKPRSTLKDGHRVYEWPIQQRDVGPPMSGWHELVTCPTRNEARDTLRRYKRDEETHRAKMEQT